MDCLIKKQIPCFGEQGRIGNNTVIWLFLICFSLALFPGCKKKEDARKGAIARVYDHYLYAGGVKNLVSKGTKREDSLALIKKFINSWTNEMLTLHKAEENLNDAQKDVEKQLKDY